MLLYEIINSHECFYFTQNISVFLQRLIDGICICFTHIKYKTPQMLLQLKLSKITIKNSFLYSEHSTPKYNH